MRDLDQNEIISPEKYFADNNFESSQVISITYDESKKLILLVLRYAMTPEFIDWLQGKDKPDSPISDFRLLVFKGVENFKAEGLWIQTKQGKADYSLRNSGVYLIDFIELKSNAELNVLVNLTSSSKMRFNFKDFYAKQRFGYAIKKQGVDEWDYFDTESDEEFDFFNPFIL